MSRYSFLPSSLPPSLRTAAALFCLAAIIPGAVCAASPAARHQQLAEAIAAELQLRNESHVPVKSFVHWVHLDQDDLVDAIVILKRHDGSCASATADCSGYLLRGVGGGFTVISSFAPNHHPLHLGPRSTGQPLRNLYYTASGEQFSEIVFRDGRYQISRRGLSIGQVKDLAPWSVTESQFDDLAEQSAVVARLGLRPLGAPIIVSVQQPPGALADEVVSAGYQSAKRLEGRLQQVFGRIAERHILSHAVQVRLVACEDWITRVPLAIQQDRSSRHVVGCLEPLGIIAKADDDAQLQMAEYLLTGTLGQALALQDNLKERLLHHIETDRSLPGEIRRHISFMVNNDPTEWLYLYGHSVADSRVSLDQAAFLHAFSVMVATQGNARAEERAKEYERLETDLGRRFQSALCARKILTNVDPWDVLEKTGNRLEQAGQKLKSLMGSLALSSDLVFVWDKGTKEPVLSPNCDTYGRLLGRLSF